MHLLMMGHWPSQKEERGKTPLPKLGKIEKSTCQNFGVRPQKIKSRSFKIFEFPFSKYCALDHPYIFH